MTTQSRNRTSRLIFVAAPLLVALGGLSGCGDCSESRFGDYRFRNGDRCLNRLDSSGSLALSPEAVTLRPASSTDTSEDVSAAMTEEAPQDEDVQEFVVRGFLDKERGSPADGYEVWVEAVPCGGRYRDDDTRCPADSETSTSPLSTAVNPSDFLKLAVVDEGGCERRTKTILACRLREDGLATFGVVPATKETPDDICIEARSGEVCRRSRLQVSYGFQDSDVVRFTSAADPLCGLSEAAPCHVPLTKLNSQACTSTPASGCDALRRELSGHIQVFTDNSPAVRNFSIFTEVAVLGDEAAERVGLIGLEQAPAVRTCDDIGAIDDRDTYAIITAGMPASQDIAICADGAASGPVRISTQVIGRLDTKVSYTYVDLSPQPAQMKVTPVPGSECATLQLASDWCYTAQLLDCDGFPIDVSEPSHVQVRQDAVQVASKPLNGNGGVVFGFVKEQDGAPAPAFEVFAPGVDLVCKF